MKKAALTALCGILSALSVILLYFSSVVWIFQYVSPLVCGLIMIILLQSANKKAAFTVYLAVSILSVFMLPDKEAALIYALFFGWYPIAKERIDKIRLVALRWLVKLLLFNVTMVAAQLILIYLLHIPFDDFLGKWGAVILLALGNFTFILYERLFTMLTFIYSKKFKSKVDKFLK
jgi:hypothetical protein